MTTGIMNHPVEQLVIREKVPDDLIVKIRECQPLR